MKVDKQVIETITWETTNSVIKDVEATIINGELVEFKFSIAPAASVGRRQNFELNLRKTDQTLQTVKKLHDVFGDLLNFMEGRGGEEVKEGRKRMIQIRDVKSSTFGDEIEEG